VARARKPAEAVHPLQSAVDAAVEAGDVQALRTAQSSLASNATDDERRCVAYGFLRLAEKASSDGRFADAHGLVRTAGVARGRPDAVVSILAGNVSVLEARRSEGEARERLLEQAAKSFEGAHHLDRRHATALFNWANALAALARLRTRAKADRLWEQAGEKYAATVALDASRVDAWTQWGHAFAEQAASKRDEEAGALLDEACVRYAEAVKLDAKRGTAWLGWAHALVRRSQTRIGSEAAALLDAAIERCRPAAKLLPGRADVLDLWAGALASRASLSVGDDTPADADRLRAQAVAKYDEAAALRPDLASLAVAAGLVLLARAGAKRGTKAEPAAKCVELATEARERLARAAKSPSSDTSVLLAIARAESLRGETARCVTALERWAAATEKPSRKALDACPDFDFVREDEGYVAFRRAMGRK
jgi:tetratricopeptide (TPR) repeat protein